MRLAFIWDNTDARTHDSPEVLVSQPPEGTVKLQVKLKDTTVLAYNHGCGEVENDGAGIIPAGALTIGFNGPWPPPESAIRMPFG